MQAQILRSFDSQIASSLKLRGLGAGRHILRDGRNWKIGELWVIGLWIAYVMPSFDPPAALAVVHEKKRARGVFVGTSGALHVIDRTATISTEFDPEWSDPVAQNLRRYDSFDVSSDPCLDGIRYELQATTQGTKAMINFSSPNTPIHVELERALFRVATEMVQAAGEQTTRNYLDVWRRYLVRGS